MKRPSGWAARGLALASGLAAALAHPPFGLLPGMLGYALILVLLQTEGPRPRRSAFFRGWLAGLGYFAVGMFWITEPFMVDAKDQGWMAPFALVLMAGGLALFWGVAGLICRALNPRSLGRVLVFAGALAGLEWLRGHIFTGLPWNLPGETWRAGSAPSQAAALAGAYGLTWITLAIAASPAILAERVGPRVKAGVLAAAFAVLGGLYGFGAWRLDRALPPMATAPVVRVVQANIDQKDKWRPENLELIFATYVDLTRRPSPTMPTIVVWPEGSLPAIIDDLLAPGSAYAPRLRDALAPHQTLLLGVNRAQQGSSGNILYFNSLLALSRDDELLRVTGIYDKHRLVPFGEFMPWAAFATKIGFRSLVHMPDDFTAGAAPRPVAPPGVPALQPLICYEALFPGFTRDAIRRSGVRPAWILNISNDAWFGAASGPRQHFNIASYRAIEEGLPIVRGTPTGVSAIIDAYGRTVPGKRLDLGEVGVIDAQLPRALPPTPFSHAGDLVFGGLLLISSAAAVRYRVR